MVKKMRLIVGYRVPVTQIPGGNHGIKTAEKGKIPVVFDYRRRQGSSLVRLNIPLLK